MTCSRCTRSLRTYLLFRFPVIIIPHINVHRLPTGQGTGISIFRPSVLLLPLLAIRYPGHDVVFFQDPRCFRALICTHTFAHTALHRYTVASNPTILAPLDIVYAIYSLALLLSLSYIVTCCIPINYSIPTEHDHEKFHRRISTADIE